MTAALKLPSFVRTPTIFSFNIQIGPVTIISALALAVFAFHRIFFLMKDRYETMLIEKNVTSILLILSMNNAKLTDKQLDDKAHLIQRKVRVLDDLDAKIKQGSLSLQHQENLKEAINTANKIFAITDALRDKLPDETKYKSPSLIDLAIEAKIVNSIIFSYKPDIECSPEEHLIREAQVERNLRTSNRVFEELEKSDMRAALKWLLPTAKKKINHSLVHVKR